MIGVEVSDNDPLQGPLLGKVGGEDSLPGLLYVVAGDAGIDGGPAIAVLQKPQIDMVEAERQRHAQPQDSGRHGDRFSTLG